MKLLLISIFVGFATAAQPWHSDAGDIQEPFRSPSLTDLDRVAQEFVSRRAREVGRKVSWWDLYGQHQHLRERPQYHKYKVDIRTSNVQYGQALHQTERPQTIQKKVYTNRTNNTISSVITWETQHASRFSWKVTRGFKAEWEVDVKIGIPGLDKPKNKTTVDIGTAREQTLTERETFSISYTLTIPPNTETTAQWVITERDQEVPFDVDVFIQGWLAIWYTDKHDGHWLWFHPVSQLQDSQFQPFENGLKFRSTGIYRGIRGVDSHIEVSEKSLNSSRTYRLAISEIPGEMD